MTQARRHWPSVIPALMFLFVLEAMPVQQAHAQTDQAKTTVFDAAAFDWLGSTLAGETNCITLRDSQKLKTENDKLVIGATGSGGPSSTYANLVRYLLGPSIKITHDYQGPQDMLASVERNEIDAFYSFTLGNVEDLWPDRLASGELVLLYNFPTPNEHTGTHDGKSLMDLVRPYDVDAVKTFLSKQTFLQPYAVPGSLPVSMRNILRVAFEKTITSEEYRKGYVRKNAPVKIANSSESTKAISRIMNAPQSEQEKYAG